MTLNQLERRVLDLERQLAELQVVVGNFRPLQSVADTFGMFGGDPDFDEMVRLGREYREQANAEES